MDKQPVKKGVQNEGGYMGKPMHAIYKTGLQVEDRLQLQDIKREKASVGNITKVDLSTDQDMDQVSHCMGGG